MGFSPFANYNFQMGVTVIGFAEHFGQCLLKRHDHGILKLRHCVAGKNDFFLYE